MTSDPSLRRVLEASKARGFLGPGPVDVHIELAEAFVAAVEPPGRFLDLGSGGGVPGLVLAARWGAEVVALDAQLRRCSFLTWALGELDLRGEVLHGRAEDLAHRPGLRASFDVVTARSFGRPSTTAECGAGFLAPSGVLLVAEPPETAVASARWPAEGLARLGLVDDGLASVARASVRRLVQSGAIDQRYPRRPKAQVSDPLFD